MHERWEHGSEYHWPLGSDLAAEGPAADAPWREHGVLTGSGRDALRLALRYGRARWGWRRLLLPEYYCQTVAGAFVQDGWDCALYPDDPTRAAPDFGSIRAREGDVALVVNYFGLRAAPDLGGLVSQGAAVLEDHTHDPWSRWAHESTAMLAIASLRKTLPVPSGGVLWSPRFAGVPEAPPVVQRRLEASRRKMDAMLLKGFYLEGSSIEKAEFRGLFEAGEAAIGDGEVSGMPSVARGLYHSNDWYGWRQRRLRNWQELASKLGRFDTLTVLVPEPPTAGVPYVCTVLFNEPEMRERVRRACIAKRVYPAVLWSLEVEAVSGISMRAREISRRILHFHCDARYGEPDMEKVAQVVGRAIGSGSARVEGGSRGTGER